MRLTADLMRKAFLALAKKLSNHVRLIVGGGGAMLLGHQFPLSTTDVDGIPTSGISIAELEPLVKQVAAELSLPPDWLNPYYSTFAHVLPSDYGTRLITVFEEQNLTVDVLSREDLLIMKCFAARQKDVIHARVLVKAGANVNFVREHIRNLAKKRIPGTEKAEKFLGEILSFFEEREQ